NEDRNEIKLEGREETEVYDFVLEHLKHLPIFKGKRNSSIYITERDPRIIFYRMVAYFVNKGKSVPFSSPEFQSYLNKHFPVRDGMVFLEDQVAEYDKRRLLVKKFTQMSLFVSDESSAIE